MPRVSDDHLEARRRQILDAARRCFSRNGFHSTSMQDILGESGLSAGAVYRYFPGKEAIIGAIAAEAVSAIAAAFDSADDDAPVLELIERALVAVDERAEADGLGRLALQVWAEAGRSESLRGHIAGAVVAARATLERRIERTNPGVDAGDAAAVVAALLPGYLHARVILGDLDSARYVRGLETLLTMARPRTEAGAGVNGAS